MQRWKASPASPYSSRWVNCIPTRNRKSEVRWGRFKIWTNRSWAFSVFPSDKALASDSTTASDEDSVTCSLCVGSNVCRIAARGEQSGECESPPSPVLMLACPTAVVPTRSVTTRRAASRLGPVHINTRPALHGIVAIKIQTVSPLHSATLCSAVRDPASELHVVCRRLFFRPCRQYNSHSPQDISEPEP